MNKFLMAFVCLFPCAIYAQTNVSFPTNLLTLTNVSGQIFTGIKIVKIDADGLVYVVPGSASGGKLKFTNLTQAVQIKFGFNPEQAETESWNKRAAELRSSAASAESLKAVLKARRDAIIRVQVYLPRSGTQMTT